MPYEIVSASKAPAQPGKSPTKSSQYFKKILGELSPGKVAVIQPDDGQTPRGIKVSAVSYTHLTLPTT